MNKKLLFDYFILISRYLLGIVFITYGFAKLSEGQFGITEIEKTTPISDLSLFRISWYMFDQQPFKFFIGLSQLCVGLLLIINRTKLFGAFLFLPIAINILVIDITFMPVELASAFVWRLSFYLLLDILIIWHHKSRIKIIWNQLIQAENKTTFKWWYYALIPVMVILLEIIGAIPKIISNL